MLHITQKSTNRHKKAIIAEIAVSLIMLAVFFAPAAKASDITVDVVLKLVNNARKTANVAILKKNDMLQKAAEEKAQDMIDNDYFAHVSPQDKSPWNWIQQNNYDYRYAGENLAIDFTNAEDEQKAWMDSPTHQKNILNENYDETGVAIKRGTIDGHEAIVVVQMFGKQMQADIASSDVSKNSIANPGIAGYESGNATNVSTTQKISDEIKLNVFLKNNSLTLTGWCIAFGLAIILIFIDIAAVIHKKHEPLFILHKTRTHNL